jgi:hypothetical protein
MAGDACAPSGFTVALRLAGFNAIGKRDDSGEYCQTIAALARSMFAQQVASVGRRAIGAVHATI